MSSLSSLLPSEAIVSGADKYPKPQGYEYSFGTAGFRTKATLLPCALYRMGLLAVLRSKKLSGKTVGVMITASHNPAADNGVKLVDPKGEMLEASWEAHAATLANAPTARDVVAVLVHLVDMLKIDLSVKASVIFGRDTRPSGDGLVKALVDGMLAMGLSDQQIGMGGEEKVGTADKGIVTTPVLHYLVRCLNTVGKGGIEEYGVPTTQGYYEKMAAAFRKLTDNKSPITAPILVDCANGVGATCLESFIPYLTAPTSPTPGPPTTQKSPAQQAPKAPAVTLIAVSTAIDSPALLNAASGADYVKTTQSLPPILLPPSPQALKNNRLACSFDGDADRIIFYYLDEQTGAFRLLDGDKQAALAAGFFVDLVKQAGLEEAGGSGEKGEREGGVEVGVVQTAYANGSSTRYLRERLPVTCVPTGVKHLHHAAERYDIGVYFEANGHGTVLFSPTFLTLLSTHQPKTPAQATALSHLSNLANLINQTVGDALSDLLLILVILIHRGWGPKEWDSSYLDLPNRLVKVLVRDRNAFKTEDAERKLVSPRGVQEKIDEEVRKYDGGRAFVRPSGTEDCVRVYAEAVSGSHAEELALRVSQIVEEASGQ